MGWHDELVGVFVLFTILNTIIIGLRVFVRTKITKGAFGWDDIAVIFIHTEMLLLIGFSLCSLHYGMYATDEKTWYDQTKANMYYFAMSVTSFIISGTVKISLALVLYRLDSRPLIRTKIVADIVTCSVWTIVTTLSLSLACMPGSPYQGTLDTSTCDEITYSQESLYIIYDVFHVILPVFILWNVQISGGLKWSITGLFRIGLLAAAAAAMKLKTTYDGSHSPAHIGYIARGYQAMIWSIVEHGLSIFTSSLLALRPLVRLIPIGWSVFLSTLDSKGSECPFRKGNSTHMPKRLNLTNTTESDEQSEIDVKASVSYRTENLQA